MKTEEFYNIAKPICQAAGFETLAVTAHAYHETGGFAKVIGKNNYFGIKTPSQSVWTGLVAEVRTSEDIVQIAGEREDHARLRALNIFRRRIDRIAPKTVDGKHYWHVTLLQTFRDWQSPEEAIKWYCNEFIRKIYPEAYNYRSVGFQYFPALIPKYATDPAYARKCIEVYKFLKSKYFPRG